MDLASHYTAIRGVHVTTVVVSIALFSLRGVLMLIGSAWLRSPWLRIAPHLIDTVLLISAVLLCVTLNQYPFVHGWLTAKVLGLAAYIVLGAIALRHGRSRELRLLALLAALLCVAYILATALHHDPDPRHWLGA